MTNYMATSLFSNPCSVCVMLVSAINLPLYDPQVNHSLKKSTFQSLEMDLSFMQQFYKYNLIENLHSLT